MSWPVGKHHLKYRTTLGRMEEGCGDEYALVKSMRRKVTLNSQQFFIAMKGEENFNLHFVYL